MNCAPNQYAPKNFVQPIAAFVPKLRKPTLEVKHCLRLAQGTPYHSHLGLVLEIFPTWRQVSTMSALPSPPDVKVVTYGGNGLEGVTTSRPRGSRSGSRILGAVGILSGTWRAEQAPGGVCW